MGDLINHLIHFGMWVFFVIFAFAVIGLIATVRWIMNLVNRTEAAVGSGVARAEDVFHKH
jgi:hypothetical protein